MRDADRTPLSVMDADSAALGGTMLCHNSSQRVVLVPSSVNGQRLTNLGAGALCCPNAERVALQEGYRRVSAEAFKHLPDTCGELTLPESLEQVDRARWIDLTPFKRVRLKRRLTQQEWAQLMERSMDAGNGYRLIHGADEGSPVLGVAAQLFGGSGKIPPIVDPEDFGLPIYMTDSQDYNKSVFVRMPCFHPGADSDAMTEDQGVVEAIARGRMGRRDPDCEAFADNLLREGVHTIDTLRQRTTILGFDPRAALYSDGARHVVIDIRPAYYYSQLLRRVMMDGHAYYVYSRKSLVQSAVRLGQTTTPFVRYLREDVGVYDASGLVTDPIISENVYEKYRMLCVL